MEPTNVRQVDGVEWVSSENSFTIGSNTFPIWVNKRNSRFLCNECDENYTRAHDLKRHYERKHDYPVHNPVGVGPIRNTRQTHRRTASIPGTIRTTPTNRVLSLSHTPAVSSPLTRQTPLEAVQVPDDTFTQTVDEALGHLTITSPTKYLFDNGPGFEGSPELATSSMEPSSEASQREDIPYKVDHKATVWSITQPDLLRPCGLAIIDNIKAILCVECRHCIAWNHAVGHLREQHKHFELDAKTITKFAVEHGLNQAPKDILSVVTTSRMFTECSWLSQKSGWWCEECGYATTSPRMADEHRASGQTLHGFLTEYVTVNGDRYPRTRGVIAGNIQTLFPLKLGGYIPSIPNVATTAHSASKIFQDILEFEKDTFEPPIIASDNPASVHPFIKISGFQEWMGTMAWKEVEALQARMRLDETWGKKLLEHCHQMMSLSFSLCTPLNQMACCHVNSPTNVIETMPFGQIVSEGAQTKYATTWARFIAFVIKCVDLSERQCRFGLSNNQHAQLLVYINLLKADDEDHRDKDARDDEDDEEDKDKEDEGDEDDDDDNVDKLGKAVEALTYLSVSLLCHAFGTDTSSDHPLIAYTILSSIHKGNTIMNPKDISPFLASLEYFCRVTVMVFSYITTLKRSKVTFYDAARKLSGWLKEGENTPFAWIRHMLHLTAKFVYGTNQMPRFIWGVDDGRSYTFDGNRIQVQDFISMVKGSVEAAVAGFFQLCKVYGIPQSLLLTSLDNVTDALAVRSRNYSFTRHPGNDDLRKRAAKCMDAAIDSGIFCRVIEDQLLWHPNTINAALSKSAAFLRSLAAAMYLGSGQPPRGTELMSTLLVNIDTRVRNIFLVNGSIRLSHFLNKTTFLLKSDKAIVREVCHALSLVLVNYIAFIRPLEARLAKQVNIPTADIEAMLQHLFQIGRLTLTTDSLTGELKILWMNFVPGFPEGFTGYGTSNTRQNMVYIGQRCAQPVTLGNEGQALLDLQAGHNSSVARNWYGVEGGRLGGDVDEATLELFSQVSRQHHKLFKLDEVAFEEGTTRPETLRPNPPVEELISQAHVTSPAIDSPIPQHPTALRPPLPSMHLSSMPSSPATPSSPTPFPFDENLFSHRFAPILADTVAKALSKLTTNPVPSPPPASNTLSLEGVPSPSISLAPSVPTIIDPATFVAMQELMPKGRFRSPEQAMATQLVWERQNHILVILPTGAGKTLIAQVATHLDRAAGKLNVILVPLKSLADDLQARLQKTGIMVERWRGPDTPWSQVVIGIFEDAGKPYFGEMIRSSIAEKKMGRIIVDECHYPFYAGDFRPAMSSLSTLVMLSVQLVLLSATIPVIDTGNLLEFYGVPRATVVRASTNRPNIRFMVQKLPLCPDHMSDEAFAYEQIKLAINSHRPRADCRVVVNMQSKALINAVLAIQKQDRSVAMQSQWVGYHADMRDVDKESALKNWRTVILVTNAFGLGVDPTNCGMVVHYEPPPSLLDYVQESGRAGRDGQSSTAILLWSRRPSTTYPQDHGRMLMGSLLDTTLCRRRIISGYMDGGGSNCLGLPVENLLCDNCDASVSRLQLARAPPPPPQEPGPQIVQATTVATASTYDNEMDTLLRILPNLVGRCLYCYLDGRAHDSHRFETWSHPHGRYDKPRFTLFQQWRDSWPKITTGTFKEHLCKYCWLPSADRRFHELDTVGVDGCLSKDIIRPLPWLIFRHEDTMDEFRSSLKNIKLDTLASWAKWLGGPSRVQTPRAYHVLIWFDERQARIPGRWSAGSSAL